MSKTNKSAVAAAVIEQIKTFDKLRPLSLRVDISKRILGIKSKEDKAIITPKPADELQKEIINNITSFINNLGIRKLQAIIKGEINLNEVVAKISMVNTTQPTITPPTEEEYNGYLNQMDDKQLFEMLKEITTYNLEFDRAAKAAKAAKVAKGIGYISIPDKDAYAIADYYIEFYTADKQNNRGRTLAPECLRGGRSANATMALRRFLFSTICRDECSVYNSLPVAAYEFYKTKPYLKVGDDAKRDLFEELKNNPDVMEMIKSWKDEPYIKSVLKK